MGREAHFVRKSKWILLFLSLFACVFASVGISVSALQETVSVHAATNIATYTVTSTSAVSTSGTAPAGSAASYFSNYGSKYQLTAGCSMTLTLSGYAGNKITGLVLSMKSNKSSGSGTLSMIVGSDTICSIPDAAFNTPSWHNGWSTSYVDVTPTVSAWNVPSGNSIVITIAASANSLYCQSFAITYRTDTNNSVTYDANGATSGSVPTDAGSYAVSASVTVVANTGSLAMSGYYFNGWNTEADGSGSGYTPGDTFTITNDTKLYAQWEEEESVDPTSAADYYNYAINQSMLRGKNGKELADDVHKYMWETAKSTRPSYAKLWDNLPLTDADPSNSNYLLDFWTGEPLPNAHDATVWNREHIWPGASSNNVWSDSSGKKEKYAGCDIHHIRPAASTVNTSRGDVSIGVVDQSKPYTNVTVNGNPSGTLIGKTTESESIMEPADDRKGDFARTIFYLYIMYSTKIQLDAKYDLSSCTSFDANYATYTGDLTVSIMDTKLIDITGSGYASTIELLLDWNEIDPVSEIEATRNNIGAGIQGNRNPFIDFPEIANLIFDPGGAVFYDLTMDSEQTIKLGTEFIPTTRTMPSSALSKVTYVSSDSTVILVSGGNTFEVVGSGTATLTGSVSIGGNLYSDSTVVTVIEPLQSLVLPTDTYSLLKGKTYTPELRYEPANAYNKAVTWSSSSSSIAKVDAISGKITAVGVGNCSIVVTSDDDPSVTATLSLTVTASLDGGVLDIEITDFPSVTGNNYANSTWSVGGYSGQGRLAKNPCMTMRSAQEACVYNSVEFSAPITKVILFSHDTNSTAESGYTLYLGSSVLEEDSAPFSTLITTPTYGGSDCWSNSSSTYTFFRLVPSDDTVHYLERIRLVFGTPDPILESLEIDYSSMDCEYDSGENLNLANLVVTAVFDDQTTADLTYGTDYSTSPANGSALTMANSEVTVSYTSDGITMTASIPISVSGTRSVSSVVVTPSTGTVSVNGTKQLTATVTYNDGTSAIISSLSLTSWNSSNTNVATVSTTGLVSGIDGGVATISATYTFQGTPYASGASSSTITVSHQFSLARTSFTCHFGDVDFVAELGALYDGEDVTADCTSSPALYDGSGHYVYSNVLGVHEFTISYMSFDETISILTTNVGACATALVTDEADLMDGHTYYIGYSAEPASFLTSDDKVLGGQNTNNRSGVAYSSGSGVALTFGKGDGYWTLYDSGESGYLYAASTSNNYLKTKAAVEDTGRWNITFDPTTSQATIRSLATNQRDDIRYNPNVKGGVENPLFSCYSRTASTSTYPHPYIYRILPSYTASSQATALKNYIDGIRTCDMTGEADVKRLALEYNALSDDAKTVFGLLYTNQDFAYGTDYVNGEYVTDTPTGTTHLCYRKIEYIVSMWNSAHPDDQIYLYTDAYYDHVDDQGTGTKTNPSLLVSPTSIHHAPEAGSPLTTTLWIVLGAGLAGMGAIGAAYWVSKKKKRFEA